MNTFFVCNTITGDVFEIMKSGLYTDKQCIEKLEARAAARGKEYRVFVLPWDATCGDVKEYGKNAAYFFAWQKERMPNVVFGTQKAIDVLTNGMEESRGEA